MQELEISDENMPGGLVYLLTRPSNTIITKIGFTSRSAESRAANYTDGGWIVHREYPMPVWLARLTEKASHEKLSQYWLDPGLTNGSASEIFTCSVEIADTAIKVAYIEQLELTLRSLRIPMEFVSLILENCGIPDLQRGESVLSGIHHELQRARQDVSKAEIYSAGAKQAFAAREAALNIEIDELRAKLEKLRKDSERNIRNLTDSLAQETQKWRDAENSLIQLRQMIKSNIDSCRSDIKLLDRYASRKISPRDFDSLRDHFFMSLKVIETLKLSAIN